MSRCVGSPITDIRERNWKGELLYSGAVMANVNSMSELLSTHGTMDSPKLGHVNLNHPRHNASHYRYKLVLANYIRGPPGY